MIAAQQPLSRTLEGCWGKFVTSSVISAVNRVNSAALCPGFAELRESAEA
jgi:hypothetical protein